MCIGNWLAGENNGTYPRCRTRSSPFIAINSELLMDGGRRFDNSIHWSERIMVPVKNMRDCYSV